MIPNQQTSVQYLLNGLATAYSFPNKIFLATDLALTFFDTATPPNPWVFVYQSANTFTNPFTGLFAVITDIDVDTGCTVTLSGPGTAGWTLDIRTNTPNVQETSIKNQGTFLPDLHEEAFDTLTREVQDLRRLTYNFGVHGPDNEVQPWPTLPSAFNRQNTVLAFDGAGLPIVVAESALGGGGGGGGGGTTIVGGVVYTFASNPAILVPADSLGIVTTFAQANGHVTVFSGNTDVTANCTFSLAAAVNCTASVNNAANNPVVGGPIGYYQINSMSADSGSITVRASFNGNNFDTVISVVKVKAGATGAPGPTGPTGSTGAPGSGTTSLNFYLTNPSQSVFAYANGSVASYAGLNGRAILISGTVDISETGTYSAVAVNCTGTVNTADNVPVNGQPIGYYEVTNMTANTATLTIRVVFSGTTLTQVYTLTTAQAGFEIVGSLPVTNLFQGRMVFLTTDNKLYRYTGSAWTPAVAATDVTGQLTASQIASIGAAQLTGTITTSQITPGAISTPLLAAGAIQTANLAAGAVVAGSLAANAVTAASILAGTITGNKIAASTITTNLVQAGAITAGLIGVTSLSSISANIGTVTAGIVQNSGGSVALNLTQGYLLFNNGSFMTVRGTGFGSTSQFIEWHGPTLSAASNWAACTEANAISYLKTNGSALFKGGVATVSGTNTGTNGYLKLPADQNGRVYIDQWGTVTVSVGASSPLAVTFATAGGIAFPTACLNLTVSSNNQGQAYLGTTTGFTLTWSSIWGGQPVSWRAFGY